jgi:hypothetical protein
VAIAPLPAKSGAEDRGHARVTRTLDDATPAPLAS